MATAIRNTDHDLLTIDEVAKRMKVCDKTVYAYMEMGLESVKIGRKRRFKPEWVTAFVEMLQRQQTSPVLPPLDIDSAKH